MIKYLSQIESETITEKPVKIEFDFSNRESVPEGKDPGHYIVISPLKVRTWFKIRPLLLQIDKEDFSKMIGEVNGETPQLISKYDELLMEVICLGIHNKKGSPPKWFYDVLCDNCTWEDVRILLNAIVYRIGFLPFCKSITILKNVSPWKSETEIIAVRNLTSWHTSAKQDS